MPLLSTPASITASSAAQPLAANSSTTSGSSSASNSASITASDFLQLLVTEMKNQDPTTQTDPNQYIQQLVQVNSLEQLIQINQDLSGSSSGSGSTSGSVSQARGATVNAAGSHAAVSRSGNLSIPRADQAASRVAQSLAPGLPSAAAKGLAAGGNQMDSPGSTLRRNSQPIPNPISNPVR